MSVCGQSHGKVRGYVGELHGALPVECAPFRDHAAGVMRRLDCARMSGCVAHAAYRGWASFTCERCTVREVVALARPAMRTGDGEGQ